MTETSDPSPSDRSGSDSSLEVLVRLALIQSAEMHDIEERAHEISERMARFTPLPNPPKTATEERDEADG